jgi:hypothetical protein
MDLVSRGLFAHFLIVGRSTSLAVFNGCMPWWRYLGEQSHLLIG